MHVCYGKSSFGLRHCPKLDALLELRIIVADTDRFAERTHEQEEYKKNQQVRVYLNRYLVLLLQVYLRLYISA
jgi:hypothetical protein